MTRRPADRLVRLGSILVAAMLVGVGVALVVGNLWYLTAHGGEDLAVYLEHTRRWLEGGSFYPARQLTGLPYEHTTPDSLYPPPSVLFFLPFLVVPAVFWWVIPLTVVGAAVIQCRPAPWAWPLITLCAVLPRTISLVIYGNSTMWVVAAVAAALVWRVPGVFILLKPSLAPFALLGVQTRAWWIGLAAIGLASISMLPMWPDWITSVTNLQGDDWTHSGFDVAFVLIPVIAYLASPTMRQQSRWWPAVVARAS